MSVFEQWRAQHGLRPSVRLNPGWHYRGFFFDGEERWGAVRQVFERWPAGHGWHPTELWAFGDGAVLLRRHDGRIVDSTAALAAMIHDGDVALVPPEGELAVFGPFGGLHASGTYVHGEPMDLLRDAVDVSRQLVSSQDATDVCREACRWYLAEPGAARLDMVRRAYTSIPTWLRPLVLEARFGGDRLVRDLIRPELDAEERSAVGVRLRDALDGAIQ